MAPDSKLPSRLVVPDEQQVARCRRAPELGPRILFLSGGTAIRDLSRSLKGYTHNSRHLITPFDSGGSSAKLREAFDMLSVGDLRNRLLALADESKTGNPEVHRLFSHRFEPDDEPERLLRCVRRMVEGLHPLTAQVPEPLRQLVVTYLRCFVDNMPAAFDLRGASLGNLVLVGGYLHHDRDIDAVILLVSKLLAVLGIVRPITDASLHLAADLTDGTTVLGQHRITGKQLAPISSPIRDLRLVRDLTSAEPASVALTERVEQHFRCAELICYPMGSFWTSVVANLLPQGVGRAIVRAGCPRVFVPNVGEDPELVGMGVHESVAVLHDYVRRDAGPATRIADVIDVVIVDSARGDYGGRLDLAHLRDMGVRVLDVALVSARSQPFLDARLLAEVLLSLV